METESYGSSISSAISSAFQGEETDSVLDDVSSVTTQEKTEQGKKLQGIEKAIDRLYRLSLIIRQPSRASQNEKAAKYTLKDDEGNNNDMGFAEAFSQIVNHRFPDAPDFLRNKLSTDIIIRRKRFLYRQSHQRKLAEAGTNAGDKKEESTAAKSVISQITLRQQDKSAQAHELKEDTTVRTIVNIAPALSRTSASAVPKRRLPLMRALDDTQSVPSTVVTTSHSVSTPVELPHPPKPGTGSKEFECPYCCLVLPIKEATAHRWRYVEFETHQLSQD